MGKNSSVAGFHSGFAITPDDSNDITGGQVAGFYVAVAGNVKVTMASGDVVTWPALAAGTPHPIHAVRIWDTDTTATGIVAGRN